MSRSLVPSSSSRRSIPLAYAARTRRTGRAALITLLAGVVVVAIAALVMVAIIRADRRAADEKLGTDLAEITGLGRPITNKLSSEFTDANGDGIADAPTDASKQIDPAEIVISYVASDRNNAEMAAAFKPFADALSKAIGKPVKYRPINDVDAQLAGLHDGSLHVTAINTGSVPDAVDVAGLVPVAVLANEGGASSYEVNIIAATNSSLKQIEDLRGHELALTDMSSNAGFKAPLVMLKDKYNLRPGFDYGTRYSMGHVESIKGLAAGTYEVAAVASDVLAREQGAGNIRADQYRTLAKSEPFPAAAFGYAHQLKPELAEKIKAALTSMHFNSGDSTGAFFAASSQTKLVPLDYAKDYAQVRAIDDAIGYEHKLRAPEASMPATVPTTQP